MRYHHTVAQSLELKYFAMVLILGVDGGGDKRAVCVIFLTRLHHLSDSGIRFRSHAY